MKAKQDNTIPYLIIGFGTILITAASISPHSVPPAVLIWGSLGLFFVLCGIWKIERYELIGDKLFKSNFLGLYKRTFDLTGVVHYKDKFINTDFGPNPLNIVRFFSNDEKYLKFRKLTLEFGDGSKVTIDERTIATEDFNKLKDKIIGIKSRRKSKQRVGIIG